MLSMFRRSRDRQGVPMLNVRDIMINGVALPRRTKLNIIASGAGADNPAEGTTELTLEGGVGEVVAPLATELAAPAVATAPAFFRGRTAALDGAQGVGFWDPASVETADNVEIFGSGTGRHKRMIDGLYNFKWFEAKGNGSDWDTAAWAEALEYCSKKSAGLFVPPGRYRIASGYTQATNYRDIFIKGCGRVNAHSEGAIRSSCIFLDSADANAFFLRCTAVSTLKVEGMMFHGAPVDDRGGFKLAGNNCHAFYDSGFLGINRPIVYEIGSYHQNASFRDIIFNSSGTIHSDAVDAGVNDPDSLVVTLLRLDNVNHENGTPYNSQKVLMDLRGCRQIVSDNLLLEGVVYANDWTALRLNNFYEAPYTRNPYAIFRTYHCEFSSSLPGTYPLKYSVDHVGGTAVFNQFAGFGVAAAPKYKLSGGGRAIIEGSGFAGTNEDPKDYFEVADATCTVELHNCVTRNPTRSAAGFTHHNTLYVESGVTPTQNSNDAAQEVWRWKGGYLAAEGASLSLAGSSTATPSSDATYGRKIVGTPSGSTLGVSIQVATKAAIGAGDQMVVMLRAKLPTFTAGLFAFSTLVDSVVVATAYRTTADSNGTVDIMLPFKLAAAAATIGVSANQGTATGMSGTLEIYSLAIYHGERIPRRQMPVYPVNVITHHTAAPTTGSWVVGDVVKNSAPSVGNPKGWVCTVAGSPGTWVSEGNL